MQSLPWDLSVSVYGRKQSETESVRVSHEAHLERRLFFKINLSNQVTHPQKSFFPGESFL